VATTSDEKHITKAGHLDKLLLTADALAYDPAAEMQVAMSRGFSEIAAFTMSFLRGYLVTSKKMTAISQAVKTIPQLTGKIEVRPQTAEAIIDALEFWYSAPAWIARYATERAHTGFQKADSVGELLLPWLMRLYSADAHVAVVVSNFIEADLFAPFDRTKLIVTYARCLHIPPDLSLPKVYEAKLTIPLCKTLGDVCKAYSLLEAVIQRTKMLRLIPEAAVTLRQLLFAYEVLISQALDKYPMFIDPSKVLDAEAVERLPSAFPALLGMLKISEAKKALKFAEGFTKEFNVSIDKAELKKLKVSYAAAMKGNTFGEFQFALSVLANIVTISIV
jgi:hypothetical protein